MENTLLMKEFIEIATADGGLSNEEMLSLYRKADAMGLSVADVDTLLAQKGLYNFDDSEAETDILLEDVDAEKFPDEPIPIRCGNCGDTLVNGECRSCGYISPDAKQDKEVSEAFREIDALLAHMQAEPQIKFLRVAWGLFLIGSTVGIYILVQLLRKKPVLGLTSKAFKNDLELLKVNLANLNDRYGSNKKVISLMPVYEEKEKQFISNRIFHTSMSVLVFITWPFWHVLVSIELYTLYKFIFIRQ